MNIKEMGKLIKFQPLKGNLADDFIGMMAFEMLNINFSGDEQYLIKQEIERIKFEFMKIEDSEEDKSACSIYDVEVVIECIHLCINYIY